MAAISFRVENEKAVRLAECLAIPNLMIICGANGSGKSTLLWALKRRIGMVFEPDKPTEVLYQGPHRAIRRQTVRRAWLGGTDAPFLDALLAESFSAPEGLQVPYPSRAPDGIDESGSAIKHALGRLENRRQSVLTNRLDAARVAGEGTLDLKLIPNVYTPLAEVVARLLPHLSFEGLDFSQEDNIRMVFVRTADGTTASLDLDDLSSGEKAVIQLLFPLVETRIRDNLDSISRLGSNTQQQEPRDRLFLLDEPELHLHPDLQRRMLAYLREQSSGTGNQFMLITHSPTILDEAADEELYVLGPPRGHENQLQKAADPSERLEALRDLTGESYFLSTGRNIVCIEGENTVKGKVSDRSLIEILNARSGRYTFVPMGGRGQVMAAIERLRGSLPVDRYGVCVVGLVDHDRGAPSVEDCVTWPFCEIENALLVTSLIIDGVKAFDAEPPAAEVVEQLFVAAGTALREDEIRLRVASTLGTHFLRPDGITEEEVRAQMEALRVAIEEQLDAEKISAAVDAATKEVDGFLADGSYLRKFRGKKLLRKVYGDLNLVNVSYERFAYALAIAAKANPAVADEMSRVFDELDAAVQSQAAPLLAPPEVEE